MLSVKECVKRPFAASLGARLSADDGRRLPASITPHSNARDVPFYLHHLQPRCHCWINVKSAWLTKASPVVDAPLPGKKKHKSMTRVINANNHPQLNARFNAPTKVKAKWRAEQQSHSIQPFNNWKPFRGIASQLASNLHTYVSIKAGATICEGIFFASELQAISGK